MGVKAGAALALLLCTACSAPVAVELDDERSNHAVAALAREGIAAQRVHDAAGYRIEVARSDAQRALSLLAREAPSAAGFDQVYGEPSLVPTPSESRARLAHATAGELSRTLETAAGVTRARVQLSLPDQSAVPLDQAKAGARASVLLQADRRAPSDRQVQALVAGAVEGLSPAAVTVVRTANPSAPKPSAPAWVRVGPLQVSAASAALARGLLGASLAVNAGLAVALMGVVYRSRRRRRHSLPASASPGSPSASSSG
jgi:type III secretory pathway lipoprotein EscJ